MIALGALSMVVSLLAASCDGGGNGAAKSAASLTARVPTAIACPASGKSSSGGSTNETTSTASTTSAAPSNASWTGVFERVHVHLEQDGSLKKTPKQLTIVSAEGHGPVTVDVPMSSSHLHRRRGFKKPDVVNGQAQVKLNLSGTATERFDSDYARSLPVSVKVTYKLNGHTISANEIKGKSGSVEVDYRLTNTTARPVSVCFKGFNGKVTKQTVSTPAPILAYLSFTVPKKISSFHAHGASLTPARSGISASWVTTMFEPIGPTTKTFTFSMKTKKASIPKATVLVEILNPLAVSGKVPAESAAALAESEAAAEKALANVQSDLAALEQQSSQPHQQKQRASAGGGSSKSHKHTSTRSDGGSAGSNSPAGSDPVTSQLAGLQAQAGGLDHASRTFGRTAGASNGSLATGSRRYVDSLAASVNQALVALRASTDHAIDGLTVSTNGSLESLRAGMGRSGGTGSIGAMMARVARLRAATIVLGRRSDSVSAESTRLAKALGDLASRLPAPVKTALLEVERINQVKLDLNAFSPAEQATPEFQKLAGDVAGAQTVANRLSSELTALATKTRVVSAAVQTFKRHLVSLKSRIAALETAVAATAESKLTAALTGAAAIEARVTRAEAAAIRATAGAVQAARRSVFSAEQSAERSVAEARQRAVQALAADERQARRSVAAADLKFSRKVAAFQRRADKAVAAARQKLKQGGQASLAAARSEAAQAEAAASKALASVDASYARLLTTNAQAEANQLPGGNADVTEQNGSFLYEIAGT